jgi:hypothetical protein
MLVVIKAQAMLEQMRAVCAPIERPGIHAHSLPRARRAEIGNLNLPRGLRAAAVAG